LRVGIYGGTFNPPHIGHESSAKAALHQLDLDLLVVVPVGVPPHKSLPPGTPSPDIRLFLTHTAFHRSPKTIVSNIEINNPGPSYTVETISVIKQIYPDAELFLLIGTDMYLSLESWKDFELLLGMVVPAVFSRNANDFRLIADHSAHIQKQYGVAIKTVMNSVVPISSSGLRAMLPKRGGVGYIKDTNYSYIIKNRIYDAKPEWNWLRERAYSMLNPERVQHVTACEAIALNLAKHWGVNEDDVREAAILHDITKKFGLDGHIRILQDHGVPVGTLKQAEEKLLHARSGAALARAVFGISDTVAEAIKWHTTGKADMSMLEKVLYLADYIEATRDFPGVEELRRLAFENIDEAMIMGLEMTVKDVQSRGIIPDQATLDALNYLKGL